MGPRRPPQPPAISGSSDPRARLSLGQEVALQALRNAAIRLESAQENEQRVIQKARDMDIPEECLTDARLFPRRNQ